MESLHNLDVPYSRSPAAFEAALLLSKCPNDDSRICDNEVTMNPGLEPKERESGRDVYDSTEFSLLPVELHFKIFSFLDQQDLITVPLVCKRWYDLSKTPIFWRCLTIHRKFDLENGCFLSKMPHLASVSLNIDGKSAITNVCLHLAIYCSHLQALSMSFCKKVNVSHIKILVHHCPNLAALNLEGCENVDDLVLGEVSGFKKLKRLNLSHCNKITGFGLTSVITRCTLLEELNVLGDTWIDDSAVLMIPIYLRDTLKSLTLDGENLTDQVYVAVSDCPKLTTLRIMYVEHMTDSGLLALMSLKELKTLEIKQGKELTAAGLCMLFECGNLNKLTELNLNGCHLLQDDAVDVFTKGCPHLQQLVLSWCWEVTDHGLEAIVNRCRFLVRLDITGLELITGFCLLHIPEKLPRLQSLDVQQCRLVANATLKLLFLSKPDLVITSYYGEVITENEDDDDDDDIEHSQNSRLKMFIMSNSIMLYTTHSTKVHN